MLLHAMVLITEVCVISIGVQVTLILILFAGLEAYERRLAPWFRAAVDLIRRPLAFQVMQAERDQARAALETATRISRRRAEATARMAKVRREHHG
jgi:hypothetical protein